MNTPNSNIALFEWHLKKNGRANSTIETYVMKLKMLSKLCDIYNPEEVKTVLANAPWQNSTKRSIVQIYTSFLEYLNKTWTPPEYTAEHKLPFIPTEQEIDSLIATGHPKTSTLLQLLKETGARIGEVAKLEWTHIDFERRTIYITAEKGSNSRILPISNKLIAMLNRLPRKNDKVFQTTTHGLRCTFEALRKRTAEKLQNPRLNKIHFHTFRHWKATMEYHKTKDPMYVKKILGHRSIISTQVYINIESQIFLQASDDWTCKATTNDKEVSELIEAGFEYIMTTPNGLMQFRKRK